MDKIIDSLLENLYISSRIVVSNNTVAMNYSEDVELFSEEAHTLKFICKNKGTSVQEIAYHSYKTKSAVSMLVDKLVKKGLVEKRRNKNDGRIYNLFPTGNGTALTKKHLKYDEEHFVDVLKKNNFDVGELTTANQVLEKLIQLYGKRE